MIPRVIDLLNAYGTAKFGDEWWPGNPNAHLPAEEAAELRGLCDRALVSSVGPDVARMVALFGKYGQAKFGDAWWPGNAQPWLGETRGMELEELLDHVDVSGPAHAAP